MERCDWVVSTVSQKHGRVMENLLLPRLEFLVSMAYMAVGFSSSMSMDTVSDLLEWQLLCSLCFTSFLADGIFSSMSGIEISSFGLLVDSGCFLTIDLVARIFQLRGLDGIFMDGAYFWRRKSILTSLQTIDFGRVWFEAFEVSGVALVT